MLTVIGQVAQPRTIYTLAELYGYLVDCDSERVFDQVACLLVGPAAREEYQFEGLAADKLVSLIQRFLADHREIFDKEARRDALIHVLLLFANASWPGAIRLLYDLPEHLR